MTSASIRASSTCIDWTPLDDESENTRGLAYRQVTYSGGMRHLKGGSFRCVCIVVLGFALFAGNASAGPGKNMATAMRALHYPKAWALKVGCHATGPGFRCKNTYRHHRVRRYVAEWAADGGFVCAGKTFAACKILKHGFMSNQTVAGNQEGSAQLASRGYMTIHYDAPDPYIAPDCAPATQPSTWSFCYWATNTERINIAVHMGRVKTGYVTTLTAATY